MKYQIVFCPRPDCVQIHVDQRLIQGSFACYPGIPTLDCDKLPESLRKFASTVAELDGVECEYSSGITFHRYEIQFSKGRLFEWSQILPHVLEALKIFAANGGLEEKGPPIRPFEPRGREMAAEEEVR